MHLPRRTFRPLPRGSRGFTLVELLVVVAIIGTLATIALMGYRKYLNNAQSSEARIVMDMIRAGEESYRQDTNTYLTCSSTLSTYYPNTNPDDSRWTWERSTDGRYTGCWAQLGVHPDAPVRYGYAVMSGTGPATPGNLDGAFRNPPVWATLPSGAPWFVVAARNQHVGSSAPSLAVTSSWDGHVYTEGEGN